MSLASIADIVNALLIIAEPEITALNPAVGAGITVFEGIAKSALAGEQSAAALVAQVKAGTALTDAQVAATNTSADADLDTAVAQLDADVAKADGAS